MTNELFFVALEPPSPQFETLSQLKQDVALKFDVKHSLKSPPHITIVPPFRFSDNQMNEILHHLQLCLFRPSHCIRIYLEGYGHFRQKVVFVKVRTTKNLIDFQKRLVRCLYANSKIPVKNELTRSFYPHLTLAHRDVTFEKFKKIMAYLKSRPIKLTFDICELTLYKYNSAKSQWESVEKLPFKKN